MKKAIKSLLENIPLTINQNELISLGVIDDNTVKFIKTEFDLDVLGYEYTLDSFAVRHILKKHGNRKQEAKRGQIAIEMEDFYALQKVVKDYDSIKYAGKTKQNLHTFQLIKGIDATYVYIVEIRTKKRALAAKTLYKKPLLP